MTTVNRTDPSDGALATDSLWRVGCVRELTLLHIVHVFTHESIQVKDIYCVFGNSSLLRIFQASLDSRLVYFLLA